MGVFLLLFTIFLIKKTKPSENSGLKEQMPYPSSKAMLLVDSEDLDEIKEIVQLVCSALKNTLKK